MAKIKNPPNNYKTGVDLGLINDEGVIDLSKTRDRLLGQIGMGIGGGDLRGMLWGEVLLIFEMGIARGQFLEQQEKK